MGAEKQESGQLSFLDTLLPPVAQVKKPDIAARYGNGTGDDLQKLSDTATRQIKPNSEGLVPNKTAKLRTKETRYVTFEEARRAYEAQKAREQREPEQEKRVDEPEVSSIHGHRGCPDN